jgi:threonine synthase
VYQVGPVRPSLAPSMDIQVASNFERFLSFAVDRDPARVREVMDAFRRTGRWEFTGWDRDVFTSSATTDAEIPYILGEAYRRFGYVADPHTACAFHTTLAGTAPGKTRVILATAHPAKFPDALEGAVGFRPTHPELEALRDKPLGKVCLPARANAVREFLAANT